ncbi:hypothetical protein PR048_014672 [Dryococelus australis]|uniref:Phospholipase B-like n=1 Tax=Dryococelus australis TaxID=614101 RepID=A0ABQ9HEX4_9NEOP|nr:hypothetical protein PR048_014672 [Dryococelus australis]
MLRMMKRYHLNYHLLPRNSFEIVPGKEIVFSSYPGALSSQDDFYVVTGPSEAAENAHKIVVAGTAIDNYSNALWSKVNTDKVLTTARVMVANRLASDGKSWSKNLEKYNSGTGNKQWVVADYGRLIRILLEQQAVQTNTLHIIEPQMTSRTALEKDDLSAHIIHVEARKSDDAAPSIRLWEVKGKNAESRESMHETQLVLETSQLFEHGEVSTLQSKEDLDAAQDMSETLDGEESFDNVESVDLNDAEWLDRSFMRSRRKFSSYKGLLWVVEQLPDLIRYSDRSHTLHKAGYWASYGLPYFKFEVVGDFIFQQDGAPPHWHLAVRGYLNEMLPQRWIGHGAAEDPKAVLFRKNQRNATDLRSVVSLMRSTNPLPDVLSSTNTQHVIAGRGDLALGAPVGTTDTKIFAGFPGQLSSLHAIAGPSYNVDSTSNDVPPHKQQQNVAKGRRALRMLGRVLNEVSYEVKEKAYGTMVRPMLEYAAAVWDPYVEVQENWKRCREGKQDR